MLFLWLDLETTGLNPGRDHLLEAAVAVTTADADLKVLVEAAWLHRPPHLGDLLADGDLDQVVVNMHRESGLWDALLDPNREHLDILRIGAEIAILLGSVRRKGEEVALAGSGVGHFDRQWVQRLWPALGSSLTYWTMDVGPGRRMAETVGNQTLVNALNQVVVTPQHRALADVHTSINQGRILLAQMAKA